MISDPNFHIGDKVVYPNHGVGIIEQISSRTMGATVEKFYLLKIKASSLKVMVPFHNVGTVGLRRVVRNGEVQKFSTTSPMGSARTTAIGNTVSRKTQRRCAPDRSWKWQRF